ncbi:glycosyltransferase family 61 protein [Lutibaculum baratangense]|uniref:Glycosyltransferase 61 catalytic domain-containing protein n=1 Tax=Lutibaculum baratangense AMV1 TaxID=631454 RepID=V4RQB2_9HYPH|nr:glycosyltransferase family 61 protein [Lutibaculum baratangense]ESR27429.1 hypothetical protein N177_0123 [Lutibaculum baratangense AMV1]
MARQDFTATDGRDAVAGGLGEGYVGATASEPFGYSYTAHDAKRSWRVEQRRTSSRLFAFRARNARPLSPSLIPVAIEGRLLRDTQMFTGYEREIWDPYLFASGAEGYAYDLPQPTIVTRPVILLPGLGSFYYHFIFDVIGALAMVPPTEWKNRLALFAQAPSPGPMLPWQNEIVSMMSIPQCQTYQGFGNNIFQDAIVCSYPSQDNAVSPSIVRFLRQRLGFPSHGPQAGKRIFFTRTGARAMGEERRRLVNDMAERYGFRCVDPMRLSVRQQRQVLSNCSVFMCEAGSGLANMLFLPEGATVVTLGTKLTFKDYFCPVAGALNLESHVVLSDVQRMFPRHQFLWSNFIPDLDMAALERCLKEVVKA